MEEQRQRQEDDQRRAIAESDVPAGGTTVAVAAATPTSSVQSGSAAVEPNTEEAMLQRALALSTETPVKRNRVRVVRLSLFFYYFKIKYVSTIFDFNNSTYFLFILCLGFR